MRSTLVDRRNGIPGSNAEDQVAAMGGPIARRASRKATDSKGTSGPGFLDLRIQSQRRVADDNDDVQVMTGEEPPDADVDLEDWTPPRTSFAERRRRLAEEQQRQRASAEPAHAPRRRTTDDIPTRRSSGRRQTDQLPRGRRGLSGGTLLILGALALIFLYLGIGWLYSAWVGVSNRLSYGPTPTSYLEAVVGDHDAPGHPTWFVAMNEHGTIVIQVAPGGDFTKITTYVMPAQTTFHNWGNLDDIVATLTVAGKGPTPNILVHLQGDPDIGHFYQRPSTTFLLLNQQPGFKVGPFVDQ